MVAFGATDGGSNPLGATINTMKLIEQDWINTRKMMAEGGYDIILCLDKDTFDYKERLIEIDNRTSTGKKFAEIYKKYKEWLDEKEKEPNRE